MKKIPIAVLVVLGFAASAAAKPLDVTHVWYLHSSSGHPAQRCTNPLPASAAVNVPDFPRVHHRQMVFATQRAHSDWFVAFTPSTLVKIWNSPGRGPFCMRVLSDAPVGVYIKFDVQSPDAQGFYHLDIARGTLTGPTEPQVGQG